MKKPSREELALWNEKLGIPEEPRPIPRVRIRGERLRYEQDGILDTLDDPPPEPRTKRRGRPVDYDVVRAKEAAQDLLLNGGLTGPQLEAWIGYCAGLSERVIAKRLGVAHTYLRRELLNPLRDRCGIPNAKDWPPKEGRIRRKRPVGLKYKRSRKS